MSDLIWIAVPAGLSREGLAVVRVLVIPRLDGVSINQAGLELWPPPGHAQASLEILVDDGTGAAPQVIPKPLQIRAQPGLWNAFFGGDLLVKTSVRRRRMLPLVVKDVSATADDVKSTLQNVAATPVTNEDRSEISGAVDRELRTRWSQVAAEDRPPVVNGGATPEPPDFNKIIGLLREHPTVLEALGLIFELPLEIRPPQRGRIKVLLKNATADLVPPSVSPWTRFAEAFRPAAADGSLTAGMLALDKREAGNDALQIPVWQLVSFDVDGAAGRFRQAAQALATEPAADPQERSLPTLRTLGISFVRRGRQHEFDRRLNRSNASLTDDTELDGEQVVLGYRFDVKPENENRWFSLHRRTADYKVARAGTLLQIGSGLVHEEGHIKPSAAIDQGDGVLRTDESVARWDGWSLSVPKPMISGSTETRSSTRSPAAPPYDFTFSFSVDGLLPRLRFSQSYRFRARLLDVAGGGIRPDDPNADRAFTDSFSYLRFEPINAPVVAVRAEDEDRLGPGESSNLVAIRSDVNLSVENFEEANPQYRTAKIRVIEPPRASLMLAEHHGAFDNVDPERSWEWVEKSFLQNESGIDPLLPDFAVVGLVVFPLTEPGAPPTSQQPRAWTEDWPDLLAKRIVLRERNGSQPVLSWESETQGIDTLIVRLAKAECLSLELSCQPKGNFVDHFAAQEKMPNASREVVRDGRHPLVNPISTVKLVHAVRQPLREPRGSLVAKRIPGQTTVDLVPSDPLLHVDPNSTSQLDLEVKNAADEGSPSVVQSIAIDRGDNALREQLRHELGDTKHRRLRYSARAHSRFRDFFAENDTGFAVVGELGIVNVPNSARPAPLSIRSVRAAFVWKEEVPTGDEIVRRRRVGGILRIELDGPWNLTGEGEQLAVVTWSDDNPPNDVWPHLTQVGRDPVFRTQYPNRFPAPSLFTTTSPIASVTLPEADTKVAVIPYDAVQEGAIWHADIAVPGIVEHSYLPFIRLALGRYQPNSIVGFELSSVVYSELVQPFPDRLLVVRRVGAGLKVRLSGNAPLGSTSSFDNFVEVAVQQLQPADADVNTTLSAQTPTDLPVAAWVTNEPFTRSFETGREFDIQLPPASGPMRLKITEVDKRSRSDADFNPTLNPLNARTIYLDLVNL